MFRHINSNKKIKNTDSIRPPNQIFDSLNRVLSNMFGRLDIELEIDTRSNIIYLKPKLRLVSQELRWRLPEIRRQMQDSDKFRLVVI
ncbi:MAG: hypothetical protein UW43_C0008G0013 [Candidatus Yanofskybacteria bacterium GW2011_GWA1_44_21]|uniref:Uncharacterized protein n=3 Tax=Parcubacteria group TaxID=1794811 RepID=A0A0G0ZT36_9BACT|nr:MAG: hypothetical protein UU85_C0006G0009 [Candidatus Wolfebacteria bacterium GW2011_GWA2_42_10]KKT50323.1 MAG: hypothetical protein UW43_C0008G0013 [Candidatus Yanofskybacteria bacterium GW2011_GWA1_44_21]KKT90162.1 MAG: hypothetical protein UW90_C0005G0017 [Candidatus Yanofskybacteria bacterium GW2011_GWB1_45_11]OGN03405.1 MAG: hypothetical protein A2657_00520 [Candidatus Yanofskybacteria bacterium RIFCSPHIGHO2_01_FULL_44_110b]OGN15006.1 MAG: hypothetical protein A3C01_02755 [Candidatus Ya